MSSGKPPEEQNRVFPSVMNRTLIQDTTGRNLWWEERNKASLGTAASSSPGLVWRDSSAPLGDRGWQRTVDQKPGAGINSILTEEKKEPEPGVVKEINMSESILPFGFSRDKTAIIRAGRLFGDTLRQMKVQVDGEELEIHIDGEDGPITGVGYDGKMLHGQNDRGYYSVGPNRRPLEWAVMTSSERIKVILNLARQQKEWKVQGLA